MEAGQAMRTAKIQASENAPGGAAKAAGPAQTEQYTNRLRRHFLLQRFWRSAAGFWRAGGDRRSLDLSAIGPAHRSVEPRGIGRDEFWNRAIFDALEQRDADTVLFWSILYVPLLAASVFFVVTQVYARMTMQWRWRAWVNNHLLDRWLTNGRYYQLNLVGGDHANPEYRIADDIRVATEAPSIFDRLTTAFLSAATFIVVLWTIGGAMTFTVGGTESPFPASS
jgi:vitamin B12/bleomycin/antimicrobial peptide transport system ATP-binding/permease protein